MSLVHYTECGTTSNIKLRFTATLDTNAKKLITSNDTRNLWLLNSVEQEENQYVSYQRLQTNEMKILFLSNLWFPLRIFHSYRLGIFGP